MARNKKQDSGYNSKFSAALQKLLKARRETQGDIAAVTGKTRQTVSQYYNGVSEPGYETLVKIADHFNVSTDYLLGRTEDPKQVPSAVDNLGLSPKAIKNIEAARRSGQMIDGLNALLESSLFYRILEAIPAYRSSIEREIKCISIGCPDSMIEPALEDELFEKYPEMEGRVALLRGDDAINFHLASLERMFGNVLNSVAGYNDLQAARKAALEELNDCSE